MVLWSVGEGGWAWGKGRGGQVKLISASARRCPGASGAWPNCVAEEEALGYVQEGQIKSPSIPQQVKI